MPVLPALLSASITAPALAAATAVTVVLAAMQFGAVPTEADERPVEIVAEAAPTSGPVRELLDGIRPDGLKQGLPVRDVLTSDAQGNDVVAVPVAAQRGDVEPNGRGRDAVAPAVVVEGEANGLPVALEADARQDNTDGTIEDLLQEELDGGSDAGDVESDINEDDVVHAASEANVESKDHDSDVGRGEDNADEPNDANDEARLEVIETARGEDVAADSRSDVATEDATTADSATDDDGLEAFLDEEAATEDVAAEDAGTQAVGNEVVATDNDNAATEDAGTQAAGAEVVGNEVVANDNDNAATEDVATEDVATEDVATEDVATEDVATEEASYEDVATDDDGPDAAPGEDSETLADQKTEASEGVTGWWNAAGPAWKSEDAGKPGHAKGLVKESKDSKGDN
jgi:hypothetical protein